MTTDEIKAFEQEYKAEFHAENRRKAEQDSLDFSRHTNEASDVVEKYNQTVLEKLYLNGDKSRPKYASEVMAERQAALNTTLLQSLDTQHAAIEMKLAKVSATLAKIEAFDPLLGLSESDLRTAQVYAPWILEDSLLPSDMAESRLRKVLSSGDKPKVIMALRYLTQRSEKFWADARHLTRPRGDGVGTADSKESQALPSYMSAGLQQLLIELERAANPKSSDLESLQERAKAAQEALRKVKSMRGDFDGTNAERRAKAWRHQ